MARGGRRPRRSSRRTPAERSRLAGADGTVNPLRLRESASWGSRPFAPLMPRTSSPSFLRSAFARTGADSATIAAIRPWLTSRDRPAAWRSTACGRCCAIVAGRVEYLSSPVGTHDCRSRATGRGACRTPRRYARLSRGSTTRSSIEFYTPRPEPPRDRRRPGRPAGPRWRAGFSRFLEARLAGKSLGKATGRSVCPLDEGQMAGRRR